MTSSLIVSAGVSAPTQTSKKNKQIASVLIPSFMGTLLEWYDFSIFAYFSPIISDLFFPYNNKWASLLSVYAVFALGFIVRPLGALLFGRIGDRLGRKKALMLSMSAICASTVGMGLLPTFEQIGLLAPVCLLLLRLVQGLCIGGETTGAAAFVLESLSKGSRGMLGSLIWSAVGAGMLLSSLASTLTSQLLTHDEIINFGWRLPFLFGLFTGIAGYYFRRKLPESALFSQIQKEGLLNKGSLWSLINQNRKTVFTIMGLYALSAMITYLIFVFMPFYAFKVMNISMRNAGIVSTIAITVVTFFLPLAGRLSDRLGRKPCLYLGASGFLLSSWPLYHMMTSYPTLSSLVIAESLFVLFAFFYQGALTTASLELSQTPVRYSVNAIGYNVSYALFGGTTPFIVTWLSGLTQYQAIPGLYLTFGSLLALLAIRFMKETADQPLG